MSKQKYSTIKDSEPFAEARRFLESKGLVDREINSTRIYFILQAKRFSSTREFNKRYKELYPMLTLNGQKWCDDLLKKVRVRKKR